MPPKSGVVICPNPRCHREIEEPILLNNLSKTPAEQYYACPHCLIKLDTEAENEKDVIEETEPSPPMHPSLEKVLDVISAKTRKEKEDKEDVEDREEAPIKHPKKEEKGSKGEESPKGCTHHFGYLAHRPKDASIPQECLTCQKIVECMIKI